MGATKKEYLGDGVYVFYDGYAIVLTVEDGRGATDMIVMEPDIYLALARYVNRLVLVAK